MEESQQGRGELLTGEILWGDRGEGRNHSNLNQKWKCLKRGERGDGSWEMGDGRMIWKYYYNLAQFLQLPSLAPTWKRLLFVKLILTTATNHSNQNQKRKWQKRGERDMGDGRIIKIKNATLTFLNNSAQFQHFFTREPDHRPHNQTTTTQVNESHSAVFKYLLSIIIIYLFYDWLKTF